MYPGGRQARQRRVVCSCGLPLRFLKKHRVLCCIYPCLLQVSKGSQYPTLLKALIVQSMIKIEEDKVTVICREADVEAVKSVVDVSSDLPHMD